MENHTQEEKKKRFEELSKLAQDNYISDKGDFVPEDYLDFDGLREYIELFRELNGYCLECKKVKSLIN